MDDMNLQPYPEYKDSGVVWLGKIPAHWECRRLGNAVNLLVSNVDKHTKEDELPIRLCNYVDVYKHEWLRSSMPYMTATATEEEIERFCLRAGDVVITKDSENWLDIAVPAYIRDQSKDWVCGYHLAILRPQTKIVIGKYLHWCLQGIEVATQFSVSANGVTRYGLSHGDIKNVFIHIPSIDEQTQIARFLDWKTAQINRFIRNKRRLIELLKEQKQNIINQAVTRGLDPNAKLKPSGVEWLGDIPEHWEARRLKTIAHVVLGKMLKTSPSKDDQLKPYLRSANIQWFEANLSDVASMWFSQSEMEQYRISKNDILVSEGGEVGRACIWQDELEECYIQNSVHKVTAGAEVFPLFLLYQFSAFGSKGAFKAVVNRVSIAHLTREKLVAVFFCKPPIEEQKTILAHIQAKTAEIDQAITRAQCEIELMREYRTRLISDVVTGQVDVRGIAVPEIAEEELLTMDEDVTEAEDIMEDVEDEGEE